MLPGSDDGPIYRDVPLSTRIRNFIGGIPLFTKTLFFTCIVVYIIQWIFWFEFEGGPEWFGMSYYEIIYRFQVWRTFSHSYFHLSILHIIFNMLALSSLGIYLERIMGTLNLFLTTICLQVLNTGFYLLIIFLLYITGIANFTNNIGCGLSGEIFSYMIFSCHFNPSARMCFGRFAIPAKIYPWAMLFFASLLFPSASFLGHLAGMFGGYLFVWFFLNRRYWNYFVSKMDRFVPSRCNNFSGYVTHEIASEREEDEESFIGRTSSWIRERFERNNSNNDNTDPELEDENGEVGGRFPGSGNVLGGASIDGGNTVVLPPPPLVLNPNRPLPSLSGHPPDVPGIRHKRTGKIVDGVVYSELNQIDDDEQEQDDKENLV